MRYPNVTPRRLSGPTNRFVAQVLLDGEERTVHVKNTGRCRELLVPGARVWLTHSPNPHRKTAYDLIAVEKGARLINMDAQAPNQVFREWAEAGGFLPGLTLLKAEQTHGDSRFDFYWEARGPKGVCGGEGGHLGGGRRRLLPRCPHPAGGEAPGGPGRLPWPRGTRPRCASSSRWPRQTSSPPNDRTHPAFGQASGRLQVGSRCWPTPAP